MTLEAGERSSWLAEPAQRNVVVFVHGILGDPYSTWREFPRLLAGDANLPTFDILLWGYRSSVFDRHNLDPADEGDALMGELSALVDRDSTMAIVAHSQGGLVALAGLVHWIERGGTVHPVNGIEHLALYATPLSGSLVARALDERIADAILRWPALRRIARWSIYRQLQALRAQASFIDTLVARVGQHVRFVPLEKSAHGTRVSLRPIIAKRDRVVDRTSASGPFASLLEPLLFEGNHRTVKLPRSRHDVRYRALASDLKVRLAAELQRLCRQAGAGPDVHERIAASERLLRVYARQFDQCLEACYGKRNVGDHDRRAVLATFVAIGARAPCPPELIVRRVIHALGIGDLGP